VVDAGVDAEVEAISARPRDRRGDLVAADALSREDVTFLLARGREIAAKASEGGMVALGEVGVGNTTVAAALAAVLLDQDPAHTVGLGAGADSAMLDRKTAVLRKALDRARGRYGDGLSTPEIALAALGGPEFAVLAGVTLGAAERGAVVVLDGLATTVAAALAVRHEPAVAAHLIAGHRSREAAHASVLDHLGLEPLLDLRIRAGEGVGACLGAGLLGSSLQIRRFTARTGTGRSVRESGSSGPFG
jgi:nicotinate-nucleotide--dimethylbenzimidazole phosphoribosyltransferase